MTKAHSLFRLTEKLFSTPHMMESSSFSRAAEFLDLRNSEGIQLYLNNPTKGNERELIYNEDTKVGVVKLTGPLTYLHYEPLCGETPTSYQLLRTEFEKLANLGAKTIVLDTDSPGGEAYGVFEAAKHMRQVADENDIKVITYVDGIAASAAYAIASISDEIIMNPSAEAGSIGVVVRLRNTAKAMKNMGVEDTYVFAGDSKIPFDAEGNFAESFLKDLQEKVDVMYGEFTSHVATMRGIDVSAVKDTQAKMFLADKAIQLGLADKVMEVEEFYSYLSDLANGENTTMLSNRFMKTNKETFSMNEFEKLQAEFEEYKATASADLSTLQATLDAKTAELAEASAQLTAAKDALAAIEEEKAQAAIAAEKAALEAKEAARKAALSAVLAEDEVEGMMTKLAALDDDAFDSVVGMMQKKEAQVEASDLTKELGVADQGDETALSDTAKYLRNKYNS